MCELRTLADLTMDPDAYPSLRMPQGCVVCATVSEDNMVQDAGEYVERRSGTRKACLFCVHVHMKATDLMMAALTAPHGR
jgi:hypothetical protein